MHDVFFISHMISAMHDTRKVKCVYTCIYYYRLGQACIIECLAGGCNLLYVSTNDMYTCTMTLFILSIYHQMSNNSSVEFI
jgi:hypothetical protein